MNGGKRRGREQRVLERERFSLFRKNKKYSKRIFSVFCFFFNETELTESQVKGLSVTIFC